MANGIKDVEYFWLIEQGVPYRGNVEGWGRVQTEITWTPGFTWVTINVLEDSPAEKRTEIEQEIVNAMIRQKILERAVYVYESRTRRYNRIRRTDRFLPGHPKCNLFVFNVITYAGASPGLPNLPGRFDLQLARVFQSDPGRRPPVTGQWKNPNFDIPGWVIVDSPAPGDVIVYSGHVGIVYNDSYSISATTTRGVVRNDWGFREGQRPVFRRFVGR